MVQGTAMLPNYNECDHCKYDSMRKHQILKLTYIALSFVMDHIDVFPRRAPAHQKNAFSLGRLEARRTPIGN